MVVILHSCVSIINLLSVNAHVLRYLELCIIEMFFMSMAC